jgi:hypothetical protein
MGLPIISKLNGKTLHKVIGATIFRGLIPGQLELPNPAHNWVWPQRSDKNKHHSPQSKNIKILTG